MTHLTRSLALRTIEPGYAIRKGIDGFWYVVKCPKLWEKPEGAQPFKKLDDALEACPKEPLKNEI